MKSSQIRKIYYVWNTKEFKVLSSLGKSEHKWNLEICPIGVFRLVSNIMEYSPNR